MPREAAHRAVPGTGVCQGAHLSTRAQIATALVALSGCDYVLGLSEPTDAAIGEAISIDAPPPVRTTCWTDGFSTIDTSRWRPPPNTAPAIFISVASDELAIDYTAGGTSSREALVSQDVVDFTEGTLAARLGLAPEATTSTLLALELADGGEAYRIEVNASFLVCIGATSSNFQYNKDRHKYLRLRHVPAADGLPEQIAYEYSGDGSSYLLLTTQPVTTPVNQVVFAIAGRIPGAVTTDTAARWDDVEFASFTCP